MPEPALSKPNKTYLFFGRSHKHRVVDVQAREDIDKWKIMQPASPNDATKGLRFTISELDYNVDMAQTLPIYNNTNTGFMSTNGSLGSEVQKEI